LVRLSNPITRIERLQLAAARLQGTPIVVMPHRCATTEEWLDQFAPSPQGERV
jgi:hypothetical protein